MKITLLQDGYVKPSTKAGQTIEVSDAEASTLIAAGVAATDKETLTQQSQAEELAMVRAENVALRNQLDALVVDESESENTSLFEGFSKPVQEALAKAGIATIEQVKSKSKAELEAIDGIGAQTAEKLLAL